MGIPDDWLKPWPDAPYGWFFCSMCLGNYKRGRPHEYAKRDYKERFKKDVEESQVYEVCDDCYHALNKCEVWDKAI